jgi:hypothetical protein
MSEKNISMAWDDLRSPEEGPSVPGEDATGNMEPEKWE